MTPAEFRAARCSLRLTTSRRDHLSFAEFGTVLGVTTRVVRRYESGATEVPGSVAAILGLLLRPDLVGDALREQRQVAPIKVRPGPGEQGEGEKAEGLGQGVGSG